MYCYPSYIHTFCGNIYINQSGFCKQKNKPYQLGSRLYTDYGNMHTSRLNLHTDKGNMHRYKGSFDKD